MQEVKKNAWYEKERLNMEEHLSTDASDPISVIKDYIRSHLSDPDWAATSRADENPHEPGLPVPHFQYENRSVAQ